jgi:hypothetical protein
MKFGSRMAILSHYLMYNELEKIKNIIDTNKKTIIIDFANMFFFFRINKYGRDNFTVTTKCDCQFNIKIDFLECMRMIVQKFRNKNVIIVGKLNHEDKINIKWIKDNIPKNFIYINTEIDWEPFDKLPEEQRIQELSFVKQYDDYICWILNTIINDSVIISNDNYREYELTSKYLQKYNIKLELIGI